ncbi:hypothetical protein L6274_04235 [Candidatus Parcubacteria bacterium]|nr:hypothetical protein [Candidatus Parcubacteria bacterium]MCG2809794.1 hypothetical protein [Candidatus Portnoybacteria bacterium]
MNKGETKNDRFKRIVTKRTNNILNKIRVLSNCSNKNSYNYTFDEVNKVFNTIEKATREARNKFYFSKNKNFKL